VTLSLLLDITIAVLLVVSIWYSTVLNKRLNALRKDKAELDKLTSNFGEATLRAGDSIIKLKNTADDLKERIDAAGKLRDDLMFLVERGGAAADRLEKGVRAARKESDPDGAEATIEKLVPAARRRVPPVGPDRSEAERELLKALQAAR
jgi:hypothetical protein